MFLFSPVTRAIAAAVGRKFLSNICLDTRETKVKPWRLIREKQRSLLRVRLKANGR